jgi:hypothetical protein
MWKMDHGVTVGGRDALRMAEKLQTNATAALPGGVDFDTAIEKDVILDDEADGARPPDTDRPPGRDRTRRRCLGGATQWAERAARPAAPRSGEAVPDLDTAAKAGNVEDSTRTLLVDLLEGD